MTKKFLAVISLSLVAIFSLGACATDADVASRNLSQAAEQFEINRRVVFVNGITDNYLLEVEGRCSVEDMSELRPQLEVTCKTGPDRFVKHFLGLSDNVTYVVEQLDDTATDVYHYRLIFKPEVIAPFIDLETSVTDG